MGGVQECAIARIVSRPLRRALGVLCSAALLGLLVVPASAAEDPLAAAKAAVARAQRQADAATAGYQAAVAEDEQLSVQIAALNERRSRTAAEVEHLRTNVRDLAVRMYKEGGSAPSWLEATDISKVAVREKYSDVISRRDGGTISDLVVAEKDLDSQLAQVRDKQAAQKAAVASKKADADRIGAALATAQRAQANLVEQLQREAMQRERDAAKARQQAEAQLGNYLRSLPRPGNGSGGGGSTPPKSNSGGNTGNTGGGNTGNTGGGGGSPTASITCPIRGALSFTDDWGSPRAVGGGHVGNDLFAARGTPVVAPVSGSVSMRQGRLQGNGVFLSGSDGNSYWMFHLDRYEGGSRSVARGEVVGYVGNTGNAAGGATHVHFEFHPGHGGPVDPYSILRAACG